MTRYRKYLSQLILFSVLCGCTTQEEPDVTLALSETTIEIGEETLASIVVTASNYRLCLYTLPKASFFWVSWPDMQRTGELLESSTRRSEKICLKPGQSHTYSVSLTFIEEGDRFLMLMDGSDVGFFEQVASVDLGVAVYPVSSVGDIGDSNEGHHTNQMVAIFVVPRAVE